MPDSWKEFVTLLGLHAHVVFWLCFYGWGHIRLTSGVGYSQNTYSIRRTLCRERFHTHIHTRTHTCTHAHTRTHTHTHTHTRHRMHNHFPIPLRTNKCSVTCHFWQLNSDFGDFSKVVCHVVNITTVETHTDMRLSRTNCLLQSQQSD